MVIETEEPKISWPEVISNPDFQYSGEKIKARAVADGLSAWACCSMASPPENFGFGMIKIGEAIGGLATEERLSQLSEEILTDK